MSNTTTKEVHVSEEVEPDAAADHAADPVTDQADDAPKAVPSRTAPWRAVAIALVVLLIGGGVFGYLKYKGAEDQLAAVHQGESNRTAAAQQAKDYALKSLTYSFEDPDAFFTKVEDGVSPALKDKYINATDLLKGVMLQAQVTSSGEVLATEVTPQPGDFYQVVVSASQTTRNLQNPNPRVSIILLQITVNKIGDTWQVTDIGPKTGSKPANANQVLPDQPGPPAAGAPAPPQPTATPPNPGNPPR